MKATNPQTSNPAMRRHQSAATSARWSRTDLEGQKIINKSDDNKQPQRNIAAGKPNTFKGKAYGGGGMSC